MTVTTGVGAAPSVTADPTGTTVVTGHPYSFTADATGSPTPDVQWQQSVDNGATWTDVVGQTSKVLTATATLAANGSEFRAAFTNASGTVTTTAAVLTVTGTEVALVQSIPTPVVGQPLTLTATVSDSVKPTSAIAGKIRFYDGATQLGSKSFSSGGTASLATPKLGPGAHGITAVWSATSKSTPVTSPSLPVTVGSAATTVKLAAAPAKGTVTTTFSLTATVKVVAPGKAKVFPGTVTFYDGATQIGSAALTSTASAKLPVTLSVGPHNITAVYQGNPGLQPSAPSNVRTVTVT